MRNKYNSVRSRVLAWKKGCALVAPRRCVWVCACTSGCSETMCEMFIQSIGNQSISIDIISRERESDGYYINENTIYISDGCVRRCWRFLFDGLWWFRESALKRIEFDYLALPSTRSSDIEWLRNKFRSIPCEISSFNRFIQCQWPQSSGMHAKVFGRRRDDCSSDIRWSIRVCCCD